MPKEEMCKIRKMKNWMLTCFICEGLDSVDIEGGGREPPIVTL